MFEKPAAITAYSNSMAAPAISHAKGYTLVVVKTDTTVQSYLDGKLSAKDMVRRLDNVVSMWETKN